MSAPERTIYTISRLNREVRLLLENGLPSLWVEGELSRISRPSSGHLYFRLKDAEAAIDCAMWRSSAARLRMEPADGQQVLVRGRVGLYEPQGRYQLIVEHMEDVGEGQLQRRLEALRTELAAAGLFDAERKRPLPALPRRIGVITSPSGAAIRDVLNVLGRRFPAIPVRIYPAPVQGAEAAQALAEMIRWAGERADCDVLILTRGGGSLEDLWSFNEEVLVRAVADCPIPLVCGVGHEVDVTLADLAADLRAPTPSGAAELVVPDQQDWLRQLAAQAQRLERGLAQALATRRERLAALRRRLSLRHPGTWLRQQSQRLDEQELRARRAMRHALALRGQRLDRSRRALAALAPSRRLPELRRRLDEAGSHLGRRMHAALSQRRQRLDAGARQLHTVSPLGTLERGYAIASDAQGRILRAADEVAVGDALDLRLARGRLRTRIEAVDED